MEPLIITLDGPAGSGKSTVARKLAKRLGLEFLDTGAMYRGITARCIDEGVAMGDDDAVIEFARTSNVRFNWETDPPRLFVNGRDVTDRLRDADVTSHVSQVSSLGGVRHVLVEEQREIGRAHPRMVTEGRDQGSVVFPGAQVKFYLDAEPAVRAKRRADQLREAGKAVDEADILEQIMQRDHRDANRQDGPLIQPDDAEAIDTTSMSLDEVLDRLERHVRQRVGRALEATR